MEHVIELWSFVLILLCAFLIGWGAEAAQTFMPKALALSLLAWLQTLPEFAVEAGIAWRQEQDLMIANLTGSLRLLVGLGWPMIYFVHYFSHSTKKKKITEVVLDRGDSLSVLFLFISIVYFLIVLAKRSLSLWDSVFLAAIYIVYLLLTLRQDIEESEDEDDMPWLVQKVLSLPPAAKYVGVVMMFLLGGAGLFVAVHPFIDTLQKWALALGVSSFVFIQWIAPFLSEFPEKVSAFNWARQKKKVGMAMMNMVNSNINQWTMLAAMIPMVYSLSAGKNMMVHLDAMHLKELGLTIAQSFLGGVLLLDLRFSFVDALLIFVLWFIQFIFVDTHIHVTIIYCAWAFIEIARKTWSFSQTGHLPAAIEALFFPGRAVKA